MKLLTKALEKQLPELYAQDGKGGDAIVYAKFFHPFSNWTFYATEYSPEERLFFGLIQGQEEELGYISIDELAAITIRGLKMERDIYFEPTPVKEVRTAGRATA